MPFQDEYFTDLVHRYSVAGPRYTSYPPAPHFSSDFTAEDYLSKLARMRMRRTNVEEGPAEYLHGHNGLSVYVHLPFCRSMCHYCGCHMLVTNGRTRIERYLHYLRKEIDLTASHVGDANQVVQLHWGGGTPTYLTPVEINQLMTAIAGHFQFTPGAEISLEADPRGLTAAHLQAAREAGFNRLSIGVQDLDPLVQEAIHRVQPAELVQDVTETARRLGFQSISYDLIYGLPHQTPDGFLNTVSQVIAMAPDRLSLFGYAHVPRTKKRQRLIRDSWLPSPEMRMRIFIAAVKMLTD
ncbi:MAG TPA: radical SAM protein [Rhodothermales bacterium]|nr:radical SAM protein [Rhodothermales bacterium]